MELSQVTKMLKTHESRRLFEYELTSLVISLSGGTRGWSLFQVERCDCEYERCDCEYGKGSGDQLIILKGYVPVPPF